MGNLCFFLCFSYSPCCYQSSGRGRVCGSTSATKKSILLPKNSHTQSYSVRHVRGSITRHISIQQFREKQEVSDQVPLRKFPSVYSTCFKMFFFFNSFLLFCSDILLITVYKTSRLVCCINFHGYLHFGSYFWKHLRHFC